MTRLVLVPTVADAPPDQPGTTIVVLDTAWTPGPGDRDDVLSIRPAVSAVLERADLVDGALVRLDAWAAATGIKDRMTVDGVAYWFRVRESMWHWLHERMLWRRAIAELLEGVDTPLDSMVVPADETALSDIADLLVAAVRPGTAAERATSAENDAGGPTVGGRAPVGRVRWWAGWPARRQRRRELERRARLLDRRVTGLASTRVGRVMVLSHMGISQRIGVPGVDRRVDPNLGGVIDRLRAAGEDPIVIGLGLDHRVETDWPAIEADNDLIPQTIVQSRWGAPDPTDPAPEEMIRSLEAAPAVALDIDGIDLGPALLAELRSFARSGLPVTRRQIPRVARLLDELRPGAILLTHEGIRTPWLVAAGRRGVPTFAVQHGVIYPTHPGYAHLRHPGLVLPTRTFVFGDYERDVLLEHGGYRDDEVAVSGSPRVDLDSATGDDAASTERDRAAVRHEMGVRDRDRMLVVSTVNLPFIRRFHVVQMLARLFDRPLPGVHLVFKKHPGELDDGPYETLLAGLARAGGYAPHRLTVVREIDLYRLLRAADAHLGLRSTVLTDAVVVGVPNLIAAVQAHSDLLGYVDAGVARPVRDVDELRDALVDPERPSADDRSAFLARHFRAGDASARIAEAVRDARRSAS